MTIDKLYRQDLLDNLGYRRPIVCDECNIVLVGAYILSDPISEELWHLCPTCVDKLEAEKSKRK